MFAELISSGTGSGPLGSGDCENGAFPSKPYICLMVGWFPEGFDEDPSVCQFGALR